jgi:hypothetical protein
LVDACLGTLSADPISWRLEWPRTDFSKHSVPFAGIKSGGPPKNGIPAIDAPRFERLADGKTTGSSAALGDTEPVIALSIGDDARAYPLRVLIWHHIENDSVGGTPVVVTYCPLCNAALVFERVVDGRVLDFGTTGKLRNSDLVMYDRQTESWWQQFTGEAIVGAMTGRHLRLMPSRLESFDRFRQRFPQGKVLIPNNPNARNYGRNPYVGYDATGQRPFLYDGSLPAGIEPMERVWPSRSCRNATKRGRSLCCGAEAPSSAPISCSNGSRDKRRLSINHQSPPAATSATSSYKSDREMSSSTSPTTSPLPSCSTRSDQIARSTKTVPILKASDRAGPPLVGRDHIRVRVETAAPFAAPKRE